MLAFMKKKKTRELQLSGKKGEQNTHVVVIIVLMCLSTYRETHVQGEIP